ncbi:sensor histidine kinase [Crossiella cryophila]|uniref:histidine kinase n=1 Tax=Crossiella cryophila TaxID=43355 RepID=A0A7W7CGI1_9PSEU|nr:ATP-binding protein [Crossiella cryophila]MBB4680685.1 signal transduction histidine kinase [Crossiella cryophila]
MTGRTRAALLDLAVFALALAVALRWPGQRPLDGLGWPLLLAGCAPLLLRTRFPLLALAAHSVLAVPYHWLDYSHEALIVPALLLLFTAAELLARPWSWLAPAAVLLITLSARVIQEGGITLGTVGTLGWLVAAAVLGAAVRATRAARSARRAEAGRRAAEERLRTAHDLHDVLAHSITVIGVQAGVAAHLLADPAPLDRAALTETLGGITEACVRARAEVRAALDSLRGPLAEESAQRLPVPGLAGLPGLLNPVRATGIRVDLRADGIGELPPALDVVAYRIVQEALTNAVRHAHATLVTVEIHRGATHLLLTVTDNGRGAPTATGGLGLTGLAERARALGGTLSTGSPPGGGFLVLAELPLPEPA